MKKIVFMLAACLAVGALASDIVLDIKLNGKWQEEGHKSGKIKQNGILVIEDVGAETNVYSGTFYFLKNKGNGNGKKHVDSTEDAEVYLLWGDKHSFGMMVDIDGAQMSGIGKAVQDDEGGYRQIIISSGQGAFIYSAFDEEVTTPGTNSVAVTNEVIAELQVGKMQARLNKRLTEEAKDSDGNTVVEAWLGMTPEKSTAK